MNPTGFLDNLNSFVQKEALFRKEDVLLCAVSGGLDSMVLVHALHSLGYAIEIAHVNFELRGEDSFLDEKLVQEWAGNHHMLFHLKRAGETLKKMPGSLQENARNFRYEWLENLATEHGIRHLVLGHHAGDQLETILLQFFRGGGIRALKGMNPSSGLRRRPLLPFSKEQLQAYAEECGLHWREDVSNAGDAYRRNQVRHQLLPLLEDVFPGYSGVLLRNAERLSLQAGVLDHTFEELNQAFLKLKNASSVEYCLDAIEAHPLGTWFLTDLLVRNGFSFSDAFSLSENCGKTESRVRSNGSGLVAEFRYPRFLFRKEGEVLLPEVCIERAEKAVFQLSDKLILRAELSSSPPQNGGLYLWSTPLENLKFPLLFRLWRAGDRIAPAGMGGKKKKVSDVLSEAKLSPTEKSTQYLLEDAGGRILWIPGIRNSEVLEEKSGPFFVLILGTADH
jgi:tRNA(Ile)-lysidine synthase